MSLMHRVDPSSAEIGQCGEVLIVGQKLQHGASHLACGCRSLRHRASADIPAHRRIASKAVCVIHVLVATEVSQSGYFVWKNRPVAERQCKDMVLLAHIRERFRLSQGTYGSPRVHADLMEDGIIAGRHRIARLMRDNNLKARQKRRFKKTTDSNHGGPAAVNHLDQDFAATAPDQKWGADISYI
jgi:HTH-like domain